LGTSACKENIMERSYESACALVRRTEGPLASRIEAFIASLIEKRYTINCVYIRAQHASAFDRWLKKRSIALIDLDESHIAQYQRSGSHRRRSRRVETQRRELCTLSQLLHFLREHGACASAHANIFPAGEIAADYGHYLKYEQGLAGATIEKCEKTALQFLIGRFGRGEVHLRDLRAADAINFVQHQAKRMQANGLKNIVTGLRSFLRYAQYRGEVGAELVAAVPAVATWATTPILPRAISAEHAQRALDSCDRGTTVGRRDYAVLLLLARLGLRSCEILRLQLDDIDWDSAHLRVRGKGGHECLLPLPTDVGEAIATYLEQGRPISKDRHLFLRALAPVRGLMEGSDAIGTIVRYALRRAKVDAPHRGSHQFRHALAVRMLQHGASLPEIGEMLRHRSPQSTSIYAKVDVRSLRALALAWPGSAR
jgi:integrase/recombinase XerD